MEISFDTHEYPLQNKGVSTKPRDTNLDCAVKEAVVFARIVRQALRADYGCMHRSRRNIHRPRSVVASAPAQ